MAPPENFADLSTVYNASKDTFHSVVGVVVDLLAPAPTRSGEWMMTFKLLDPKLRDAIYGNQGITVRFFKKDLQHLPRVRNLGDIALIRNIKVAPWNQQPLLLSNYQTSVVVFPSASIPDPNFQLAFQGSKRLECLGVPMDKDQVTMDEQSYAIALKHDMKDAVDGLPSTNVVGFGGNGYQSSSEPAAKRPRLSEPSLPSRPPPQKRPSEPSVRTRQSDGLPQIVAKPARQSSFGPKFKLVKELAHFNFADICAQIVKKYPLPYGGCDLYVSDYTSNKDMWFYPPPEAEDNSERDGDVFGYAGGLSKRQFPGPYEFNVLKVNVKDPHAHFVNQKVAEGDFVLLRNVKMKIKSEGAKLEGDMWPDDRNPEKVQVSKLMNHDLEEIRDVLQRKQRYWASRKTKLDKEESAKQTKTEKRKARKKEKAEKAEKKAAESGGRDAVLKIQAKATDPNPHVRCSNDEVPVSSVKDILDLDNERHTNTPPGAGESYIIPFINAKYRARVRVVEYEPKALEDFSVLADPEDEEDRSINSIEGVSWQTSQKYIWSFRLLLEDALSTKSGDTCERDRIWITFHHESAQYLFGNDVDDPSNLRTDKQLLAKLKEKMCILWGNLEERTVYLEEQRRMERREEESEAVKLSNRPFECCLMEYGVPIEPEGGEQAMESGSEANRFGLGYRRMFAGLGVTIT